MKFIILSITILWFVGPIQSQELMKPDTNATKSINGLVNEFLRLQSSDSGKKRNWDALRNLFLPSATFTILNVGDSIRPATETVNLDEFMEYLHDDSYENGYVESEIRHTTEEFNGIASVFQSFQGKDSNKIEARGMNCYQLAYFKDRWWIVNMLWTLETEKIKLPSKYLGKN